MLHYARDMKHAAMTNRGPRPMPTQEFISRLVKSGLLPRDAETLDLLTGDILECHPAEGGTFYQGDYLCTRIFRCVFEDGSERSYFLRLGEPVEIKAGVMGGAA
jgi:hypothetical protein